MATAETTGADRRTEHDGFDEDVKPSLRELKGRSWRFAAKRALKEFSADGCTDLAAALTYFSVLSIFPALLALVSILGLVGEPEQTKTTILDVLDQLGTGSVSDTLEGPLEQMVTSSAAGLGLVVGLAGALWSASGYVGAFGRALNKIYEVPEGRKFIKLRPMQLVVTAVLLVLAAAIILSVAVSGDLARVIGDTIGLGDAAVMAWNIAKWPVILLVVVFMVGLLYWATPNVRQPKFRWLSPGAAVAIVVAILASVVFGFYVSNFGSYNKTYGSLAGVIVTLLWLWIINNVLLLGAELDSEIERSRQLQAGLPAEDELPLPLRDTTKSDAAAEAQGEIVEEARSLRIEGLHDQGRSAADLADRDRPE
ncbi:MULTISPECIES: YihY/virulence factor BrkB family protein [Janibacter]|jgi:membrane protein|uniref:YihY/virulence factor BrkB family protein n=1 Tax=Janibacter TaxID=53457 RepID=UPI00082A2456|nr:YihY/virulence factor BrkB family protein [Janibacter terrae]HBO53974.1 YihY/virulence factor BrkB family protein [Janibacter terrae]HCE60219.1 YihY/virulence factor BrkB family protein [Janibacter terrae]